jgi:hypothetical protein
MNRQEKNKWVGIVLAKRMVMALVEDVMIVVLTYGTLLYVNLLRSSYLLPWS